MGARELIRDNWRVLRDRAREEWRYLTDEDLDYIDGSYDRLTERLCDRCGLKEEDAAKRAIEDWLTAVGRGRLRGG